MAFTRHPHFSIADALALRDELAEPVDGPNDRLFDSDEEAHEGIDNFWLKKWRDAISDQDMTWTRAFDGLGPTDFQAVNDIVNRLEYRPDVGRDAWAKPSELFARGFGDCEDFAIAKFLALKHLGFDPDHMRLVRVEDTGRTPPVGHAVLAVYHDGKILILDNQIAQVFDCRRVSHYRPVQSMNEHRWWSHSQSGDGAVEVAEGPQ